MKPKFVLEAEPSGGLSSLLAAGYEAGLRQGIVIYDPSTTLTFTAPPFRFHFLPQRSLRPKSARGSPPSPQGVRLPHAACPFDSEEFVRLREVARVVRAERSYSLVCNKYPVTPLHFLAVRAAGEPEETLPQYIQGAHELEDMILLLIMLGGPYRFYFNSNRGADGSLSGSSMNHWHFQIFPRFADSPSSDSILPAKILLEEPWTSAKPGSGEKSRLWVGSLGAWPARHLFVEAHAGEFAAAAAFLWRNIETLNRWNVAYNVEAQPLSDGRFRLYLFPRRPAAPAVVPGAGSLSPDMGGCELLGEIIIHAREFFDWICSHPEEATELVGTMLSATTRPAPSH